MGPKPPRVTITPKKNKKNENMPPVAKQANAGGALANQHDSLGSINYVEVQTEEIEVLKAIFMDDYEDVEMKSAWSKTSDKAFKLRLKSLTDENTFVNLSVQLTATYPKSAPILHVDGLNNLHTTARRKVEEVVRCRPAEMVGEPMIHDIATDICDILEDAVLARDQGVLPSLEEERMIQENAAEQQARDAEADEIKRNEAARAEEDRALDDLVQQSLQKRERELQNRARASGVQSPPEDVLASNDEVRFDQTISLAPRTDLPAFDTVKLVSTIFTKALSPKANTSIFAANPKLHNYSGTNADMLAVRQVRFTLPSADKASLLEFEDVLEILKPLRQPNIVNVYAFTIEKLDAEGEPESQDRLVSILTDLANRGSLAEMLEDGQTIPLPKARSWSLDLLDALEHYHRHGVVHKRIHANNVLFFRSSSGVTMPKLADAGYEDRLLRLQGRPSAAEKGKKLAGWLAPEITADGKTHTRRSDVWDFGVLLLQMLLGNVITRKHSSPDMLLDSLNLSEPLDEVLRKVFSKDAKDRPSAFDLTTNEFFRSDIPLMSNEQSHSSRRRRQSSSYEFSGQRSPVARRSRQNSSSANEAPHVSRYLSEWIELGRLGKGGFGEVVKARNKVDGGVYAIKKVRQESAAELRKVLPEVMLLRRLNHPYVVRYYSSWVEDDYTNVYQSDEEAMTDSYSRSISAEIGHGPSTTSSRGLDFVSSGGYEIEFGEDSDGEEVGEEDENEDDEASGTETGINRAKRRSSIPETSSSHTNEDSQDTDSFQLQKTRSGSHRNSPSTMYIQMEYCERRTLRDLIRSKMYAKPNTAFQMLRQILEGLAHIHSFGIIHRDLKPDNVFIDVTGSPRIGDFGLATTSRHTAADRILASTNTGEDMTRSIGTALYVAPEISSGTGNYNDKVDMYSLGIIFFEMCYPLETAMERHQVLIKIRERKHNLPSDFQVSEYPVQADIILSLIKHAPSERPSSVELLRSGKIPVQIEDETIRQMLQSMVDSGSPYYQKMMTAFFTQTQDQRVRGLEWEAKASKDKVPSAEEYRVRDITRKMVHDIFRVHGAEEIEQPVIFDRSNFYTTPAIFQVLDSFGTLLQLPYDFTLPRARQLAKQGTQGDVEKSFVFGHVYRESSLGGPPKRIGVVDFDIVARESRDLTLHDAECMKVVDEIVDAIPALSSANMCFYINHSDLLEVILEYCGIEKAQRPAVKESLSNLNIHNYSWTNLRAELRSPVLGIHATSVDELARFDFRETFEKTCEKLQAMLEGSNLGRRTRRPLDQIKEVIDQMKMLGIKRKVYLCPLSCLNEKLYTSNLYFQCINDKKNRVVLAAGGRYDSLIEAHRSRGQPTPGQCHAVSVSINWDAVIHSILRHDRNKSNAVYLKKGNEETSSSLWAAKRVSYSSQMHTGGSLLIRSCDYSAMF